MAWAKGQNKARQLKHNAKKAVLLVLAILTVASGLFAVYTPKAAALSSCPDATCGTGKAPQPPADAHWVDLSGFTQINYKGQIYKGPSKQQTLNGQPVVSYLGPACPPGQSPGGFGGNGGTCQSTCPQAILFTSYYVTASSADFGGVTFGANGCSDYGSAKTISIAPGAIWTDNHQTLWYLGDSYTNQKGQPANKFFNTTGCTKEIYFPQGNSPASAKDAFYSYQSPAGQGGGNNCSPNWQSPVTIEVDPAANNKPGGIDNGSGSTGNNGGNVDLGCGAWPNVLFNPLNWILCPVTLALGKIVNTLDDEITKELCVNTSTIFGSADYDTQNTTCDTGGVGSSSTYKNAWNAFRVFGLGIIVITALIMVLSQTTGFEVFDAYTIRKVLPRLLIAAIAITLSWNLLSFLVAVTNDFGVGIKSLMLAPFPNADISLTKWNGGTGMFLTSAGAVAIIGALGMAGLLSFVATAFLALLIAFVVLILRQVAILLLIIIAPIAIACYVLPNTQKAWKLWWESLSKALLMFVFIEMFIAAGKIFATLALSRGSDSWSNNVIAFIAFIAPFFLLPLTFRWAGGLLGTLGGFVNDRGRGGFDRLKKFRAGQVEKNLSNMKDGTRFNNRALNSLTSRATTSRFGIGKRGRAAYEQKMALATGAFARSAAGQSIQFNDPALRAMTYSSALEARQRMGQDWGMSQDEIEESIAAVKANGGFGRTRQAWATKQLAATGTGYDDEAQMYSTIARVAAGNAELGKSMWGEMRGASERAGRNDLKAGYAMGAKAIDQIISSGDANAGTSAIRQKYADTFDELGLDAARGVDNMTLLRNKPKSIKNIMRSLDRRRQRNEQIIADTSQPADVRAKAEVELGQIRAKMENMESYTQYGPEINSEYVYGERHIGVVDRDGRGEATRVEITREPGIKESLEPAISAQQSAAEAAEPYREERQRTLTREEALRAGREAEDAGHSPEPE